MNKKLILLLTILIALTFVFVGCANETEEDPGQQQDTTAEEDLTVGFIYVGPAGDGGWSDSHDYGRQAVEEELGVKTIYKENVPDLEVEKVMRDMIDQGAKVIFATSYGYMDYVEKVAKEYPDVKFLHASGVKSADNFINYFGRMYQARYLAGIVAGMKTETNKIGYVGAYEIPEVIRGINAFTLGVRSVNPDADVIVRWTHTWYDPALEKEAAIALLDEGADVITQHQDTAGPQQAAEERGAYSIGYHTDMSNVAPEANMTSAIWNWKPYYIDQVKAVMEGAWEANNYWGGLEDGIVALSPLTEKAPEDAQAKVDEATAAIKDGSLEVFEGPIKDQNGEIKVEEGVVLTDEELLGMMWFVEGVVGKVE